MRFVRAVLAATPPRDCGASLRQDNSLGGLTHALLSPARAPTLRVYECRPLRPSSPEVVLLIRFYFHGVRYGFWAGGEEGLEDGEADVV